MLQVILHRLSFEARLEHSWVQDSIHLTERLLIEIEQVFKRYSSWEGKATTALNLALFRLVTLLSLVVLTLKVLILYHRNELTRVTDIGKHRARIHVYESIGEDSVSIYISP